MYTPEGKRVDYMEFEIEHTVLRRKPRCKEPQYTEIKETYTILAHVVEK